MAADPPRSQRRRPRPGSLERPVSGRLYRGTWLLVALPLLLAAFTVFRPLALPGPSLPAAFDAHAALVLAKDLALHHPNRVPGSPGAIGAARWFHDQLLPYGFVTQAERFTQDIPGLGRVRLTNLVAIAPGRDRNRWIVVMAHRDNVAGPGANDNASGTAALIELARAYANPRAAAGGAPSSQQVSPTYTLIFLSTDGGAWGGAGAARFAASSPYRRGALAVVNLDSIAGPDPPRLEFAGDLPRSPAATLLETAAAEIQAESGRPPSRPSALRQLVDLGFPFTLYEQGPFVARGIPAVTLTTGPDRPPASSGDTTRRLDATRLGEIGRAAQNLLGSLDQALDLARGTSSYVYLGSRVVRGWAVALVLIAALLPFLAAIVDLFARCRRRRIPVAPALRSYRSRLGFWLWCGAVFGGLALLGAWGQRTARPLPPAGSGASWPGLGLVVLAVLAVPAWLVTRERLLPRRPISAEEELAGYTGTLLVLGVVGIMVVATNPFALIFVLPSLHAWLWLAQVRAGRAWARVAVLAAGFLGPALLLWSFASRYGLGMRAPWYVVRLFAVGYAPAPALLVVLAWAAAAAQLTTIVAGRYAPYPRASERPPRGPLRELVRRIVLAQRARRRGTAAPRRALES